MSIWWNKVLSLQTLPNLSWSGRLWIATGELSPSEQAKLIKLWQKKKQKNSDWSFVAINCTYCQHQPASLQTLWGFCLCVSVCQRSMGKHYLPDFTAAIHGLTPPLFAICLPPVRERGRHTRPLKWRHEESRVTHRLLHRHHGRCVRLK